MNQVNKICPFCGKVFVSEHNARKFCGEKCALIAAKKRRRKKRSFLCQWCGQVFPAHRQKKFCTTECQSVYMRKLGVFKKTVVKVPVKITIEDVAKGSKEEKLTYGRYVSMKKI